MLVFIDDSGDPGFKVGKGSTECFVIAMVIFFDPLEAERTALAIRELKRELRFPDDVEFKFFKSSNNVKVRFFEKMRAFNFTIRCIVVKKELIHSQELRSNKNSFYAYFIKEVLKHSGNEILNAKVRIDGSGDRMFRKSFLTYLRRELVREGTPIMENCKLVDSRTNALIQLADMVAGSINRAATDKRPNAKLYKQIIQKKITDEWPFR